MEVLQGNMTKGERETYQQHGQWSNKRLNEFILFRWVEHKRPILPSGSLLDPFSIMLFSW